MHTHVHEHAYNDWTTIFDANLVYPAAAPPSFIRSSLLAEVQPTLDLNAESS